MACLFSAWLLVPTAFAEPGTSPNSPPDVDQDSIDQEQPIDSIDQNEPGTESDERTLAGDAPAETEPVIESSGNNSEPAAAKQSLDNFDPAAQPSATSQPAANAQPTPAEQPPPAGTAAPVLAPPTPAANTGSIPVEPEATDDNTAAESAAGTAKLQELISKAGRGEPVINDLVRSLVELATRKSQFPKEVEELNLDQPVFRTALGAAIYNTAAEKFSTKSSAELLGLKKLAQKFLEPTDPNHRAVIRLFALVERCEHLSATTNILDLVELRKSSGSKIEAAILERFITKTIFDKVESLLEAGSPGKALRVLAEIEPDLRTTKTLDLCRRVLLAIRQEIVEKRFDSNDWPFEVAKVKALVDWSTEKDKALLPILGEVYTWPLLMAVKNNDAGVAERMYKQVLTLRPDPNPENDTLRLTIALAAKGGDAKSFAAERVAELAEAGKLTWSDKLKLLGSGYYGFMSSIFVTFGIVALLCAVFFILFRPLMQKRKVVEEQKRPRPKNVKGYQVPYEEEDEYSKLLRIFGLNDEATEDDIKKAFRVKVKELHPDAQGPQPADMMQNQEFIDLRKSYDRIMEIRRSWFGA